jgi:hypothetical protein
MNFMQLWQRQTMANNDNQRTTRGANQDRKRVAGKQYYETNYIARKLRVPTSRVEEAIKAVGNDRKKVEDYIQNRGKRNR